MLARTPGALKKRKYRQRQRDGVILLRIEAKEADLVEALIASERLNDVQSLDRAELERAAGDVLREWCQRWRHKA
jgi:hypothetical protein